MVHSNHVLPFISVLVFAGMVCIAVTKYISKNFFTTIVKKIIGVLIAITPIKQVGDEAESSSSQNAASNSQQDSTDLSDTPTLLERWADGVITDIQQLLPGGVPTPPTVRTGLGNNIMNVFDNLAIIAQHADPTTVAITTSVLLSITAMMYARVHVGLVDTALRHIGRIYPTLGILPSLAGSHVAAVTGPAAGIGIFSLWNVYQRQNILALADRVTN
jgi:hypothetical protein